MANYLVVLLTIVALTCQVQAKVLFGSRLSSGYVRPASWIRESNTTLVLPAVPNPVAPLLAIWPRMVTSGGDLIQGVAFSTTRIFDDCGGQLDQWCVAASTLGSDQQCEDKCQIWGEKVKANEGDHILMHYKYNDDTGAYDQTVSINGDIVSTLSTESGHALGWEVTVEAQWEAVRSTTERHEYLDTILVLDEADPEYGDSVSLDSVDDTGFTTSDGGKTWSVKTIALGANSFQGELDG